MRYETDDSWMHRAACRGLDPDLFYPERGAEGETAKGVCRRCPVKTQCLEYALANYEFFGIWGGESDRSRRRIKKQRASAA